jgi:hypothetical protein
MSATLFFLVPIGMLAVVWSLCFVGCLLQTHGLGEGTPYSNGILAEQSLVAYWPLSDLLNELDTEGATSAAGDLSGHGHNGTYTIPPLYPVLQQSMQFAVPALKRETSIVPGDVSTSDVVDQNPFPASVDFEGGYVSIPWSAPSALDQFTLEFWIKPNWTGDQFWWVVFSAFINNTGFRIFVNDKNHWELVVGTGPGNMTGAIDTMLSIDPTSSQPTYVALTCDPTGIMQLWINPQSADTNTPTPLPAAWTSPMPTGYVAIAASQPVTYFIGAGANDQPLRTPTTNPGGAPLYPFQGEIQSVALYGSVLSPLTILEHFMNGSTP